MSKDISPSIKSIVVLLNNISELIVKSNKRKEAEDVMKAIVVYAGSKSIKISQEKLNSFYGRLFDARPYTLSSLVMDIARDLLNKDIETKRASIKRDKLDKIRQLQKDKKDKKDDDTYKEDTTNKFPR